MESRGIWMCVEFRVVRGVSNSENSDCFGVSVTSKSEKNPSQSSEHNRGDSTDDGAIDWMLSKLEEVFDEVDVDGTGKVDMEDFYDIMVSLNLQVTQDESNIIFQVIDANSSGRITLPQISEQFDQLIGATCMGASLSTLGEIAGERRLSLERTAEVEAAISSSLMEFTGGSADLSAVPEMTGLVAFDSYDSLGRGSMGQPRGKQLHRKGAKLRKA